MNRIKTYGMAERADYFDFDIRAQQVREPLEQPHRHEYFQIQVNLEGDTRQTISGTTRPFPRGGLSFVLPYRVHLVPHPPGARYVIINFAQRFLWPELAVDALDLEDLPVSQAPALAPFLFQEYLDFELDAQGLAEAETLIARLMAENRRRGFGSSTAIRGLLLQLIGLVCARYEADLLHLARHHAGSSRRESVRRVLAHIGAHLAENLTLNDAAAAAFLSPNYLAHLLKKETGKTFTELVAERRMALARDLLAHTARGVAQVAHAAGFADEAYFSRRFRQLEGVSPTGYRERLRGDGARTPPKVAQEAGQKTGQKTAQTGRQDTPRNARNRPRIA
ncbi:AraC family transcriptional regulator [Achromobacter xylosoxidans]|uniref:helix-turn-helix transcriptional regulator n=1 Tax=Alcaligenes xylosoxydans xylosoxydans TaxID=85698 RepID=UPI00203C1DFE|nr:AraC family transcriptional regulator [Achromobacter xylosoxidans]MCM2572791.1 AraC family transcriptional regulator [Achromobacter xylosoxidans]